MLLRKQAGFRHGSSTVNQVTFLTHEIEDGFSAKMKAGDVFVNLTPPYDTVWHQGFICKLPYLLSERHMVSLIMEIVHNRCFTLTTGTGKQNRLQRLKNDVPQGSFLDFFLFNIYTYDLPVIIGGKYAYADDLATFHYANDWQAIEGTLSQDMAILSSYPYQWKLKLSTTKTVSAASIFTTRRHDVSLTSMSTDRSYRFVLSHLS